MRTLVVIALLMAPLPAIGQTFEIGPGGVQVYPRGGGGDCRALRAACMHKEELGEVGPGQLPPLSRDVRERGAWLLALIAKLGFAGYFLIVWDIIRYCQRNGLPRAGPRFGGQLRCLLCARNHRRRSRRHGAALRAIS